MVSGSKPSKAAGTELRISFGLLLGLELNLGVGAGFVLGSIELSVSEGSGQETLSCRSSVIIAGTSN